jgi:UDP-N-acetylglucosamine 1-carboxyvinyltransferase
MDRIVIEGGVSLRGKVRASGSKNSTLPLMAAALLADSPTVIRGVPDLRDIQTMAEVIRSLGATVGFRNHTLTVDPAGFSITEAPYDIVRKMRASVYVMGPMIARLGRAKVSMPGGCAIGPRPIDLHLKGFEALGCRIGFDHGYLLAEAEKPRGAEFNLSGPAGSSVGATCNVLMAAVLAKGKTVIHGAAMEPDVVELCGMLGKMGAKIEGAGAATITVRGVRSLKGIRHKVVTDRIEAGTFMTAAAITRGDVTIEDAPVGDMDATIDKLREVGASVEIDRRTIRVRADGCDLKPTNIVTFTYPGFATDMQAQFMALLAVVPGASTIRETIYVDRFMHAAELNRMGADIRVNAGMATIHGVDRLSGAPVMASDLRASAALVVAGLAASGTTQVNRVYHIDRGYERIERKLEGLGARIRRVSDSEPDDPAAEPA